jgi:hypothetical protein
MTLTKTFYFQQPLPHETFEAVFPAGYGLIRRPTQIDFLSAPTAPPRACPVPGSSQLSAGPIRLKAPDGTAIDIAPANQPNGVAYQRTLPNGFIGQGPYTAVGSGPVLFQAAITAPAPPTILNDFSAGIPTDRGLTIRWSGGAPGAIVKILVESYGGGLYEDTADAMAGQYTFLPICSGFHIVVCELPIGPVPGSNVRVVVEEVPGPGSVSTIKASGITSDVQLAWVYRYEFDNLHLVPGS